MSKLDAEEREKLPKEDFALPGKRSHSGGEGGYPIENRGHAQDALARVAQHGSPSEKKEVREKVHEKYPDMKLKEEKSTLPHEQEPYQCRYPNAPATHPESVTPPPTPTHKGPFSELENLPTLTIKDAFNKIIGPLDSKCK